MSDFPTGTITLLFTDVEGSTRLARRLGDGYGSMLEDQRRLLRDAVTRHHGQVVDASGDGCFVAFATARDGLQGAVGAQRALTAFEWPGDVAVRTRMALHTGEPTRGAEGYHGVGVHLAARLCQSGRGGQILLSEATRTLVADELPDGVTVRRLGERALKDFDEAIPAFEVVADGLPDVGDDLDAKETSISVVLAEDSVLLREGVAQLLTRAGFDVVGQVDNADDLLRRVGFSKPDVAIVDIRMPPTHTDEGLQAARRIRERHPQVGVLVLSQYVEPGYAIALLAERTEGTGYLLKDRVADVGEFTDAVRRVAAGGSALDPEVVSQLIGRRRVGDPVGELTAREREVLGLMAEGRSNHGIAQQLVVTERAVEKHVTNIFAKLGLAAVPENHRRVRAVLAFLES